MASLIRSVLSTFSGSVAGILISSLFTPLVVRILSQEQYGLFASILAAVSVLTLISQGGLFDATRKHVAEYADSPSRVSALISASLSLSIVYAAIVSLVVLLGAATGLIPSAYSTYVWLIVGILVFGNVFSVVRGVFYGLQREDFGESLRVSRNLLYSVVALLLAYVGFDIYGIFLGYALSFVVLVCIGLVAVQRYCTLSLPSLDEVVGQGKTVATYGSFQLIGGLSGTLLYKSDILLVDFFRSSTETALYNSAIIPAEMIWFVPSAIQLAFLQHTAHNWANNDIDTINDNIRVGIKYSILSLSLFGTGLFVLSDPFLQVYFGPQYAGASSTLKILIVGTFFLGVTRPINPVLQATGWVRQAELVTVCGLVVNLLLNVLLIPRYGIAGAGIGTATSYVAIFIGNLTLWWRSPFAMVPGKWVAKLVSVQILFFVCFSSVFYLVDVSPTVSLVVFPLFGGILFATLNVGAGHIPLAVVQNKLKSLIG